MEITVEQIKNDILKIIDKDKGYCLCGHTEWCDRCSSLSPANLLRDELKSYLNKL